MMSLRPRLARETRLLLVTVVLSAGTLLVLARFRFPDAPPPALPREQPLQRLAAEALFDELAATVALARSRAAPFVPVLQLDAAVGSPPAGAGPRRWFAPALRFRDDLAVAVVGSAGQLGVLTGEGVSDAALVAEDAVRGYAVVRLRGVSPLGGPPPLDPEPPRTTGYAVAIDGAPGGVVARPMFVDRFDPLPGAFWPAARALPPALQPGQPGTVVVDLAGRILGMVVGRPHPALVPASTLVRAAERLLTASASPPATMGVELQDLDRALASATLAAHGAVVAFVDPTGPAAGVLRGGDVIEEVQGEAVASAADVIQRVRASGPGSSVLLGVRRGGESSVLQVTLAAPVAASGAASGEAPARRPPELGLTLAAERGSGSRVRAVAAGTAAARAGLEVGDVIAWIGDDERPAPSAVRRAYADAAPGTSILVGVARAGAHRVLVVEKR